MTIMSNVGSAHNVTLLGSGETTVVLGHGFGTNQSVWRHLVPQLVDQYQVLLYDNMGTNTTDPDLYDFERYSSVEGYADDLIAILEKFKVERCVFIGHSISALAAIVASISRPKLFRKIIMLATTPRVAKTENCCWGLRPEELEQFAAAVEENPAALYECLAPSMVGGGLDSPAVQEFLQNVSGIRENIVAHLFRFMTTLDMRAYLGRVTVPCHIIQSSKDMMAPVEAGEFIRRSLGGKTVMEVVPAEGHLPHLSSPEIVNPVVLRHVKEDIVEEPMGKKEG